METTNCITNPETKLLQRLYTSISIRQTCATKGIILTAKDNTDTKFIDESSWTNEILSPLNKINEPRKTFCGNTYIFTDNCGHHYY